MPITSPRFHLLKCATLTKGVNSGFIFRSIHLGPNLFPCHDNNIIWLVICTSYEGIVPAFILVIMASSFMEGNLLSLVDSFFPLAAIKEYGRGGSIFILGCRWSTPCPPWKVVLCNFPQFVCSAQYGCIFFFFCSSLISFFPGMLPRYCLSYIDLLKPKTYIMYHQL